MNLQLYAHPFSSYCQKALIAFYENDIPFEYLNLDKPEVGAEFASVWPIRRFPVLIDGEELVAEATIIVEHLAVHHPGRVELLPRRSADALPVRLLDRFFDNYVMTPLQKIVGDALRALDERDAKGVADARLLLDTSYEWLDRHMKEREWAGGTDFSLADCAAAPSLFYADWAHPIPERLSDLRQYRVRLLARPSFARAVEEARPYRSYFPLGAPDRD